VQQNIKIHELARHDTESIYLNKVDHSKTCSKQHINKFVEIQTHFDIGGNGRSLQNSEIIFDKLTYLLLDINPNLAKNTH